MTPLAIPGTAIGSNAYSDSDGEASKRRVWIDHSCHDRL